MITITHTRGEGTLIDGSAKGDGVYEILRGLHDNWRSFRSLGCLGLGQSRDKAAQTQKIERAAGALRQAGYEVRVSIDDNTPGRDIAQIEADAYGRAQDKTARYGQRAAGASARGTQMREETSQVYGALNGTPVLTGHHSEHKHRNLLARLEAKDRRASGEMSRGRYWAGRAEAAAHYQAGREDIPATLRRISRLEAGERRLHRILDGTQHTSSGRPEGSYRDRLEADLAHVHGQLAHWREHVKAAQASGVKLWGKDDFTKGDFAQSRGRWYEVLRVNAKTITVPGGPDIQPVITSKNRHYPWNGTIGYDQISDRKSASEMTAILDTTRKPPT